MMTLTNHGSSVPVGELPAECYPLPAPSSASWRDLNKEGAEDWGYKAGLGLTNSDNPYTHTELRALWQKGFNRGRREIESRRATAPTGGAVS